MTPRSGSPPRVEGLRRFHGEGDAQHGILPAGSDSRTGTVGGEAQLGSWKPSPVPPGYSFPPGRPAERAAEVELNSRSARPGPAVPTPEMEKRRLRRSAGSSTKR